MGATVASATVVTGSIAFAASMADIVVDLAAFQRGFKDMLEAQFASEGLAISGDTITITSIYAGSVVVRYSISLPPDVDRDAVASANLAIMATAATGAVEVETGVGVLTSADPGVLPDMQDGSQRQPVNSSMSSPPASSFFVECSSSPVCGILLLVLAPLVAACACCWCVTRTSQKGAGSWCPSWPKTTKVKRFDGYDGVTYP